MLFDRFWKLYPRKQNKQGARRAWNKLSPDMELCRTMSAALRRQMQSEEWTKDGGRFVPYPSTWLNGRRWEDEVPPPPGEAEPPKEAWGWGA